MRKTVEFQWEGKTHKIPKLRMRGYKEFVRLQKRLKDPDQEVQIEACIQMMECLGCPSEVLEELGIDEFQSCLDILSRSHFGAGEVKNGEAAGVTQKENSGGSPPN